VSSACASAALAPVAAHAAADTAAAASAKLLANSDLARRRALLPGNVTARTPPKHFAWAPLVELVREHDAARLRAAAALGPRLVLSSKRSSLVTLAIGSPGTGVHVNSRHGHAGHFDACQADFICSG
jgi:hypothetical protein